MTPRDFASLMDAGERMSRRPLEDSNPDEGPVSALMSWYSQRRRPTAPTRAQQAGPSSPPPPEGPARLPRRRQNAQRRHHHGLATPKKKKRGVSGSPAYRPPGTNPFAQTQRPGTLTCRAAPPLRLAQTVWSSPPLAHSRPAENQPPPPPPKITRAGLVFYGHTSVVR